MTETEIIRSVRQKVCKAIEVEREGIDRYIVYTPFMFDDGDHYVVILRRENGHWVLTDEGHTFMHLSYGEVDLSKGTRARIIEQALASHRVHNDAGELRLRVPGDDFGDAVFSFVQAISRVSSTALWTRERVDATFREDFDQIIRGHVPLDHWYANYHDEEIDADGIYPADYMIKGRSRPCLVFGVSSDQQCQQATITCQHYETKGRRVRSMAVFEDQTAINRRLVAQLSNVVGKQFASLDSERIVRYIRDEVLENQ